MKIHGNLEYHSAREVLRRISENIKMKVATASDIEAEPIYRKAVEEYAPCDNLLYKIKAGSNAGELRNGDIVNTLQITEHLTYKISGTYSIEMCWTECGNYIDGEQHDLDLIRVFKQ